MRTCISKRIWKMKVIAILMVVLLMPSSRAVAGDFYWGITTEGVNYFSLGSQLPIYLLNKYCGTEFPFSLSYDWLTVKDAQGSIPLKQGSPFGTKFEDLFNYIGYGLTFGYQPEFSMFGIAANVGYNFRQFKMQPDRALSDLEKYKVHSFTAGISIRFTPLVARVNDSFNEYYERWSPVIEVGTKYNHVFSCRAPYNNAKDQLNNGMSMRVGAGVRFPNFSVTLAYEMPTYDYFNKDFVAPDQSKPYANIKSKSHNVSINLFVDF